MFFIFSKVLAFLIRPLTWILLLLVGSWWLGRRRSRWSGRLLVAALVVLLVFSNRALFQLVAVTWEPEAIALTEPYDVAIVLGGYLGEAGRQAAAPPEFSERADRLLAPIALYQQGMVRQLLLSGGTSTLLMERQPEAHTAGHYARLLGVAEEDLILETRARNTYENAVYSAELLKECPASGRYLLVTSAWHLPRAAACFRKTGLRFTPYPIDFLQSRVPLAPADYFLPRAQTLDDWESLIKEWVGIAVYRLRGYL
jgi:uncharacterized SAM-binding protein YcdF (DUF218 family)